LKTVNGSRRAREPVQGDAVLDDSDTRGGKLRYTVLENLKVERVPFDRFPYLLFPGLAWEPVIR
jgi:hypothetical protein